MGTSDEYDLVVVGFGAAALAAAVAFTEATERAGSPGRIAMIERAPRTDRGGSTRWTTAGMRIDEQFRLDPMWVGQVQEASDQLADLDYCLEFERQVPTTCRFLVDRGVELQVGPAAFAGGPAHTGRPNGGGHAIVETLGSLVDAYPNTEVCYETEAVRLELTDEGRVGGVLVRGPDGLLRTVRGRSVVLACGGFEGNYEMLTRYVGQDAVRLRKLAPGTRFNQGDGIRMVTEIGGATAGQFDGIHAELVDVRTDRADAVLYGHTWTIAVNAEGKRFFDEGEKVFTENFELIAYEVWRNQDQTAFLITDEAVMGQNVLTGLFDTDVPPAKADTVADLALQLGLDPAALEKTVAEFNAACVDGPFDPFRLDDKHTEGIHPPKSNWANPIAQPPYYGYPVAAAICFTYGGVRTDTSARVVTGNGTPIPGLYAAGELVGLFYHEYVAATSVLKALTFGRIAGEHAAATTDRVG